MSLELKDVMDINFDLLLSGIRAKRIITNPFPNEPEPKKRWFKKEGVNIWEAYQKGYDKAYQEVKDSLKQEIRQELQHILDMQRLHKEMESYYSKEIKELREKGTITIKGLSNA